MYTRYAGFAPGILILFLLQGCTAMKYVPEDRVLFTDYELKIEPRGRVRAKRSIDGLMDQNVSPRPNSKILGMRPGLWFYYVAGPATEKKKFRTFVRTKLGQVPVYLSDVDAERTANLIEQHLINNGYFDASVDHRIEIKDKQASITYTASISRPYRLRNISYPVPTRVFVDIDSIKINSYLRQGQRYSLERLQAEQSRIEKELENQGYFYFDDRHLIFEADTTVGDRKIDLTLLLEEGVPAQATTIYRIGSVNVFPNYSLSEDSTKAPDTPIRIYGYNYFEQGEYFRPQTIVNVINLRPGDIYRRVNEDYTLSHLMNLGSFKFVDINFQHADKDSATLDAYIYLTPHLRKSIRGEFQLTSKSNNFVGPGLNITFTNRNFLKGSERFEIRITTGYEVQFSSRLDKPLNAFELGAESTLSIPRFVTPIKINYTSRRYLPATNIGLKFRLQQRIGYFRLNSFNLAYGFNWRENSLKNHELYPIDISYLRLGKTSPLFDELVERNVFLRRSLENQFILGARYAYTVNTQVDQIRLETYNADPTRGHDYFFNGTIETSGNLVHVLRGGQFKQNLEDDSTETIFGAAYAQYLRAEADFRYYYQLDEHNKLAARIVVGSGYAYGNSVTMPYIRQFSVGGSNSIRAFPARSIGPGTYDFLSDRNVDHQILFLDQRGDLKLEGSIEYRFDIIKALKGAVFFDAGNIWLWREDTLRPGSRFDRHRFLDELAAGAGAGLRLDFSFFVLRFDLAFPVRKPFYPPSQRWVFNEIDPGSRTWRRQNLVFNIAIGYPF